MEVRWTQQSRYLEFARNLKMIQDGSCGICGATGELVLDHDHRTNYVRGWLCRSCNAWLGHNLDKYGADFIKAVLAYLKDPPAKYVETHPMITERRIRCGRCHLEKTYSNFHRYRHGGVFRFSGYCKSCQSQYSRDRASNLKSLKAKGS